MINFFFSKFKAQCPISWQYFASSCYWKFPIRRTWSEARNECGRFRADLVVIESDKEFDYIAKNITDLGEDFYVGFNYSNGKNFLETLLKKYLKSIRFLVMDQWSRIIRLSILYRRRSM